MERQPISQKIRFEIFKRDSFKCQYCGRAAPEVVLHVDHIKPVAKGGENEITNLITACQDCNLGKKDRELSDDTVMQKRKAQLDELQERREQLEMMVEWQTSLLDIEDDAIEKICEYWDRLIPGRELNEHGKKYLKKLLKKYGLQEVLEAMKISVEQYYIPCPSHDDNGTASKVIDYLAPILSKRKLFLKEPRLQSFYYNTGIMAKRFRVYYPSMRNEVISLMQQMNDCGVPLQVIREDIFDFTNVYKWIEFAEKVICAFYDRKDNNG